MNPITLIIVDDHRLIRETWSYILNSDPRFKVIGECATGEEALITIPQKQPDIAIMDINLPGLNGIQVTEKLCRETFCTSKILGVSLHKQPSYTKRMIEAGAMGYVTKNSSKHEMFDAIISIFNGQLYVCNEIKQSMSQTDRLSIAV